MPHVLIRLARCWGVAIPLHLSPFTFPGLLLPFALQAQDPAPIADNSFLVEEAYNQEAGVVQHIATLSRVHGGRAWDAGLTGEWPLGDIRHQLGFTIPVLDPEGSAAAGFGDVALNYRYQLAGGDAAVHLAPRATLFLPTGSDRAGRGAGTAGVQLNLPVSWDLGRALVTHWNAGVTVVSSAADFNLGASGIWRVRRSFNLLVEAVWLEPDGLFLNPGVRWAHDFPGDLQIVPGIAYTIPLESDAGPDALFFYVSIEHPFRR